MVKNLKSLRVASGMSQKQLADVISVSQQSINKYENHDVEPNIDTLIAIADIFNTSVDYLVGATDITRRIEVTNNCELNEQEMNLINSYRNLGKDDKILLNSLIERMKK